MAFTVSEDLKKARTGTIIVGQGFQASIDVEVVNNGNTEGTIEVALYVDVSCIQTLTISSLSLNAQTALRFTWNTQKLSFASRGPMSFPFFKLLR